MSFVRIKDPQKLSEYLRELAAKTKLARQTSEAEATGSISSLLDTQKSLSPIIELLSGKSDRQKARESRQTESIADIDKRQSVANLVEALGAELVRQNADIEESNDLLNRIGRESENIKDAIDNMTLIMHEKGARDTEILQMMLNLTEAIPDAETKIRLQDEIRDNIEQIEIAKDVHGNDYEINTSISVFSKDEPEVSVRLTGRDTIEGLYGELSKEHRDRAIELLNGTGDPYDEDEIVDTAAMEYLNDFEEVTRGYDDYKNPKNMMAIVKEDGKNKFIVVGNAEGILRGTYPNFYAYKNPSESVVRLIDTYNNDPPEVFAVVLDEIAKSENTTGSKPRREVISIFQKLGYPKITETTTNNKIKEFGEYIDAFEKGTLKKLIRSKKNQTTGQGLKPKYIPRSYKIVGGCFGKLNIDEDELEGNRLVVFKNGEMIANQEVDDDTVDILTKKHRQRPYSDEAINVFRDVVYLSELPAIKCAKHKYVADITGSYPSYSGGKTVYNIPDQPSEIDLKIDRLGLLVSSMKAGNDSVLIRNEISNIIDYLYNNGAIDKNEYKSIAKKYVLPA